MLYSTIHIPVLSLILTSFIKAFPSSAGSCSKSHVASTVLSSRIVVQLPFFHDMDFLSAMSFMTWTLLKHIVYVIDGALICLSNVSSWLDWSHAFLPRVPWKWWWIFLRASHLEVLVSSCPSWGMLIWLPDQSFLWLLHCIVVSFPFPINKQSVGEIESCLLEWLV